MIEPVPIVIPTVYEVSILPDHHPERGHFAVKVEYRGDNQYAVTHRNGCLSRDGEWDFEPRNSERTEEWLNEHRFVLHEAIALASAEARKLTVNGVSVLNILAKGAG